MADINRDIVESDPAATSLHNDETIAGADAVATETSVEAATAKPEETESAAEFKTGAMPEVKPEDIPMKGTEDAGEVKAETKPQRKKFVGKSASKFDPSVLEKTDDAKEIRKQVSRVSLFNSDRD
jgi:hypothetical protein